MPHPSILKALGMSAADWGKIPDGPERLALRRMALDILENKKPPLTASASELEMQKRIIETGQSDMLSRSGFESAMTQQAKFFGEAIEGLRARIKKLEDLQAAVVADSGKSDKGHK